MNVVALYLTWKIRCFFEKEKVFLFTRYFVQFARVYSYIWLKSPFTIHHHHHMYYTTYSCYIKEDVEKKKHLSGCENTQCTKRSKIFLCSTYSIILYIATVIYNMKDDGKSIPKKTPYYIPGYSTYAVYLVIL